MPAWLIRCGGVVEAARIIESGDTAGSTFAAMLEQMDPLAKAGDASRCDFWKGETMKPVDQTKFGATQGNCFIACVASILECPIESLPDLDSIEAAGKNWLIGLNEELDELGYCIAHFQASTEKPAEVYIPKGCHFIAAGEGYGGIPHAVVYRQIDDCIDSRMVHDPMPDRRPAGLKTLTSISLIVKK